MNKNKLFKKLSNVLLLFIFIFVFCSESVNAQVTLLFSDDFDRASGGVVGNGWTESEPASTESRIDGGFLLLIDSSSSNSVRVERNITGFESGKSYIINVSVNISSVTKTLHFHPSNSSPSYYVRFYDTGYIEFSNFTTLNNIFAPSSFTVYNFITKLYLNNNTYSYEIQPGNYKRDNLGLWSNSTPFMFRIETGSSSSGYRATFDFIKIYLINESSGTNVIVNDVYDNNPVIGANVTIFNNSVVMSSLTNVQGTAFFNVTGNFSFNITHPLYFNFISHYNISSSNNTVTAYITGSHVNFNFTNLKKEFVNNFSISSGNQFNNSFNNFNARLVLKPNATNTILFNKTGYKPLSFIINTTGKDSRSLTINDTYQALININLSFFGQQVNGFNATVYGDGYNLTNSTTGNNITFPVMLGNISLFIEPFNYSNAYENRTITGDSNITITIYFINSIFFNFFSEKTRQRINNVSLELISNTYSTNASTTNGLINFSLLSPNDYTVRYSSVGYTNREYFLKLNNKESQNNSLYLLEINDAVLLVIRVIDTTGNPLRGAEVQIRRYFVNNNNYEVVAMCKTSYDGLCYFDVHELVGFYKIAATYGTKSFITTTPEKFIYTGSVIKKDIVFNTGEMFYESYQALPQITRTLTFNNATNTFSFAWVDPTGIVYKGCLILEYPNGTKWSSMESCQNTGNGNVLVTINESITYKYKAVLYTSTNYSDLIVFSGFKNAIKSMNFGKAGVFLGGGLIITLTIAGAFISAAVSLIALLIGVLFVTFTGLMPFSYTAVASFSAVTIGIIIYMMRR